MTLFASGALRRVPCAAHGVQALYCVRNSLRQGRRPHHNAPASGAATQPGFFAGRPAPYPALVSRPLPPARKAHCCRSAGIFSQCDHDSTGCALGLVRIKLGFAVWAHRICRPYGQGFDSPSLSMGPSFTPTKIPRGVLTAGHTGTATYSPCIHAAA